MGEQIKYNYMLINNYYTIYQIVKSTLTEYITDTGTFENWYNNYDWINISGSMTAQGEMVQYNDKVTTTTKSGVSYSYHFKQDGSCYMQYENDVTSNKMFNPKNIAYYNYSDEYLYEVVRIP